MNDWETLTPLLVYIQANLGVRSQLMRTAGSSSLEIGYAGSDESNEDALEVRSFGKIGR